MNLLIEGTLNTPALPRFAGPQSVTECHQLPESFDDALETACSVIASHSACYGQSSAQCMLARTELQLMVQEELRRVQRFEQLRRIEAVSNALALTTGGLHKVAA